jgi:hypothetical protein
MMVDHQQIARNGMQQAMRLIGGIAWWVRGVLVLQFYFRQVL